MALNMSTPYPHFVPVPLTHTFNRITCVYKDLSACFLNDHISNISKKHI
ncbi:hypothetical protein C2W63_03394 [Bacillus velezensis]|nr:hypothetical protein C2W63_03394 [Bacillus velezensis]